MSAEAASLRIEVSPAGREEEPLLANLLELYSYELSEAFNLNLRPDGRFGYPSLPLYWQEQGRYPFVVRVDGHLAGFVLVAKGSRLRADPNVWDVAEFFVLRRYRQRGVGTVVARSVWSRFAGPWEVRVLRSNEAALTFWRTTIHRLTSSSTEETLESNGRTWQLFRFESEAPVHAVNVQPPPSR